MSLAGEDAAQALAAAAALRGSLLFHLHLAETLACEAVADRVDAAGWALDVGPDGYEAVAVGAGEPPATLAQVTFSAEGRALVDLRPGRRASERQLVLSQTRGAALDFAAGLAERHLVLVAPPARDGRRLGVLDAYVVRLAPGLQDVTLGPHLCLPMLDGRAGAPRAVNAVELVLAGVSGTRRRVAVVHPDGPAPSEMHVFLSLRHGIELEVATPPSGLRWLVQGERIGRLG